MFAFAVALITLGCLPSCGSEGDDAFPRGKIANRIGADSRDGEAGWTSAPSGATSGTVAESNRDEQPHADFETTEPNVQSAADIQYGPSTTATPTASPRATTTSTAAVIPTAAPTLVIAAFASV